MAFVWKWLSQCEKTARNEPGKVESPFTAVQVLTQCIPPVARSHVLFPLLGFSSLIISAVTVLTCSKCLHQSHRTRQRCIVQSKGCFVFLPLVIRVETIWWRDLLEASQDAHVGLSVYGWMDICAAILKSLEILYKFDGTSNEKLSLSQSQANNTSSLVLPGAAWCWVYVTLQGCKWLLYKCPIEEGNGRTEDWNGRKSCFSWLKGLSQGAGELTMAPSVHRAEHSGNLLPKRLRFYGGSSLIKLDNTRTARLKCNASALIAQNNQRHLDAAQTCYYFASCTM